MDRLFHAAEKLKNKFKSPLERTLYDATSNENWSAPNKILQEIADSSYNYQELRVITTYIMEVINQRKNWRRIMKVIKYRTNFLFKSFLPIFIKSA